MTAEASAEPFHITATLVPTTRSSKTNANAGFPAICANFSNPLRDEERSLKRHLYAHLYDSDALRPIRIEAQRIVSDLARFYRDNAAALPDGWHCGEGERARLRGIGDYLAGMTDRFAIARHEELVGPVNMPDRF